MKFIWYIFLWKPSLQLKKLSSSSKMWPWSLLNLITMENCPFNGFIHTLMFTDGLLLYISTLYPYRWKTERSTYTFPLITVLIVLVAFANLRDYRWMQVFAVMGDSKLSACLEYFLYHLKWQLPIYSRHKIILFFHIPS